MMASLEGVWISHLDISSLHYIETTLAFKFALFWTPYFKTFTYRLRIFKALINILNGILKFLAHVCSYFRGRAPHCIEADGKCDCSLEKYSFTTNTTCL